MKTTLKNKFVYLAILSLLVILSGVGCSSDTQKEGMMKEDTMMEKEGMKEEGSKMKEEEMMK